MREYWPRYKCRDCGGESLSIEAFVRQDDLGLYISGVCDDGHYCEDCDREVKIDIAGEPNEPEGK